MTVKPHAQTWCRKCAVALYCSESCRQADDLHALDSLCGVPWPVLLGETAALAAVLAHRAQVSCFCFSSLPEFKGELLYNKLYMLILSFARLGLQSYWVVSMLNNAGNIL